MCNRFVSSHSVEEISAEFDVAAVTVDAPLAPDFNVAPTKPVYAVLERSAERQLHAVRWGLVPSWAKDPGVGRRLTNARVETVAEKPSFRSAFARRRAILPADGYYEWHDKQPYYFRRPDDGILAFAGLYELWKDPEAEDEWLWSATILTTDATDQLGHLHDRTPMVVPREEYDTWLRTGPADHLELTSVLVPATGLVVAHPVGAAVGNVRSQGPGLIDPLLPGSDR